jgi:HSP20 family protein
MAQTEKQGTPAAAQGGTTGAQSTESSSAQTGQSEKRVSRREGWEDPLTHLFGGSPFALFRSLSDDMDRLFFGGRSQGGGTLGAFGGRFLPQIDIQERDDKLVVRADLPGVKPDDFRVDIEDDALVLSGERRDEREENRGGIRRAERTYGSFRRVIPLPQGADVENAAARFENGVLEIEIPFQQQAKTRRLQVQTGPTSSSTTSDPTRH